MIIRFQVVWVLAVAGLLGFALLSTPRGAFAYEWSKYEFSEDAPEDVLSMVRNHLADAIDSANATYPENPTQILIGRRRNMDWEQFSTSMNWVRFYVILGGNPRFCDENGCALFAVVKPSGGDPLLGSHEVSRTNGYVVQTDMFYNLVEMRKGCATVSLIDGNRSNIGNEPCSDWSASESRSRAHALRSELETAFEKAGVSAHKFRLEGLNLGFRIAHSNHHAAAENIIDRLRSDYDFSLERKGLCYLLTVKKLPEGLFYHEVNDTKIRWVTN